MADTGLTSRIGRRLRVLLPLLLIIAGELIVFALGPFGMAKERSGADLIFLSMIIIHAFLLYTLAVRDGRELFTNLARIPEILFSVSLLFFLFSYIYAMNANMSYAQWFAETSGNLRLAPDSRIQRLNSLLRYAPFLIYDAVLIVWSRLAGGLKRRLFRRIACAAFSGAPAPEPSSAETSFGHKVVRWALPLTLFSALLYTAALPSFVSLRGLAPLGFICLVPLYPVLRHCSYRWSLFYGVLFGSLQAMLANYWLGTYSLISLHFAVTVHLVEFTLFFVPALYILRKFPRYQVWLLPLMWTAFDYLRSSGFLGYPWGILGTSQYRFLPFIQIAALGGVWAVSLAVHLTNALIAEASERALGGAPPTGTSPGGAAVGDTPPTGTSPNDTALGKNRVKRPLSALLLLWVFVLGYGGLSLLYWNGRSPEKTIRVALIQQNTDPRKHDYRRTFNTLEKLTSRVLPEDPDLIAWSETAFVPNIRKWGAMDPSKHSLAKLVHDFRDFQRETDTWLLTGNDDYEETTLSNGEVEKRHYNATVLFNGKGERVKTYRKIRLVPFTEYFPYKERFPWLHSLLKDFDATLWEKGKEAVVFQHPKASFSTPICFEDSFPGEIRVFIKAGAEMILNLSNDFWSRTRVEGEQHFANSLFRAVEHRRPLLRSTASGKTAYVAPTGAIRAELPYYREETLVADAALYGRPDTLYGIAGDWLPRLALVVAFLALVFPATTPPEETTPPEKV